MMGHIELVSASAGSGKTYRLAEILTEAIGSREARPESILATTFTNKAAAELRERVRGGLIAAGRVDEAQRLVAARIGTVNSVCGAITTEFGFELGLSPHVRVLDEAEAKQVLQRVLSEVVEREQEDELADLESRLPSLSRSFGPGGRRDGLHGWEVAVNDVTSSARANGLTSDDLAQSCERSVHGMLALLGDLETDGSEIEQEMRAALTRFIDESREIGDGGRDSVAYVRRTETVLDALSTPGRDLPPWADWVGLVHDQPNARLREPSAPVREAAARHERHPQFRSDIRRAIELVFSIAAAALEAYAQYKGDRGVIDFRDQEAKAQELLGKLHVQEALASGLDLVLVDEFQDTSPIQLAVFLRLARIARRSVWVGDQKQAIYGFRGADPALMDAVVAAIEKSGREVDVLKRSWRSRPDLVELTSGLFARAFGPHGVPADRVRLVAASPSEPGGLGDVMEHWRIGGRRTDELAQAVAAGVAELLGDPDVMVRDRRTGAARQVAAGDVAVLCAKNNTCHAVCRGLQSLGIPASVPTKALLTTPEGQMVLRALQWWADPSDRLAQATLVRLSEGAEKPDAWFADLLSERGASGFRDAAILARLRALRNGAGCEGDHGDQSEPEGTDAVADAAAAGLPAIGHGILSVFDAVVEATEARRLCRRWGRGDERLANLEKLRARAAVYISHCTVQGAGCTVAGLVRYLAEADVALDEGSGATHAQAAAVAVSTKHSAKGLEWPVVVVCNFDDPSPRLPLGVHVDSDAAELSLDDPLRGRWIRYWPAPYHASRANSAFHDRLREHPVTAVATEQSERERLRLLYMSWTRARDRVILATKPGKLTDGYFGAMKDSDGNPLLNETADATQVGELTVRTIRSPQLREAVAREYAEEVDYAVPGPQVHPARYVKLSEVEAVADAGELVRLHGRLATAGDIDWESLGEAIHGFFAADDQSLAPQTRLDTATGLLARWGVAGAVLPEALVEAADALRRWVATTWPGATWHREWPVFLRLQSGTIGRGFSDLILETPEGLVVIDHKSFPGSTEQAVERARHHAGQLSAYARAAQSALNAVDVECYVHLPISGLVVPVLARQ